MNIGCPHCNGRVIMPGAPTPAPAKPAIVTPLPGQSGGSDPLDFLDSLPSSKNTPPPLPSARRTTKTKSPVGRRNLILIGCVALVVLVVVGKALVDIQQSNKSLDQIDKHIETERHRFTGGDTTPNRSVMTREQFREAVMNKTQEQVIQAVGRPDSTMNFGFPAWQYNQRTQDSTTGNTDHFAQVLFQGGAVVTNVSFF
jgi:hypothetical protein